MKIDSVVCISFEIDSMHENKYKKITLNGSLAIICHLLMHILNKCTFSTKKKELMNFFAVFLFYRHNKSYGKYRIKYKQKIIIAIVHRQLNR